MVVGGGRDKANHQIARHLKREHAALTDAAKLAAVKRTTLRPFEDLRSTLHARGIEWARAPYHGRTVRIRIPPPLGS